MNVVELTPLLLSDWLAFLDGPAWTDNPDWAGCYCWFFHYTGPLEDWKNGTACASPSANRAAKCASISSGESRGWLAYDEGTVVGWVNAAPRASFANLTPVTEPNDAGAIVCFVIHPSHRRRGVAAALLSAACDGFRRDGLSIAEAFPNKNADGDAEHYRGPLSMYKAAGFTIERELKNHYMVRKPL